MKIVFLSRNCVHHVVSSIVIGSLRGLILIHIINIMPLVTCFVFIALINYIIRAGKTMFPSRALSMPGDKDVVVVLCRVTVYIIIIIIL